MPAISIGSRAPGLLAASLASAALAACLASCGADGGTASFLTPGPTTSAPPGNTILYAASSRGDRIDAYRLGTDGLMPAAPFDSLFIANPRRLAIRDGVLYATTFDRVISARLGADGSLPEVPTSATISASNF